MCVNFSCFSWLRSKFESADKDNNGALNMDEVVKILAQLNLKMDKKHIKTLFNVRVVEIEIIVIFRFWCVRLDSFKIKYSKPTYGLA